MKIKPIQKKDLKILEEELNHNTLPWLHGKKLKEQLKGNTLWFIAWEDKEPIAHVQIRFEGSNSPEVKLKDCPHVETLYVKDKFRKQGVATKIMNFCERLVKKKGYSRIGLAVEKGNKFLLKLYNERGYNDWEKGLVIEFWKEQHGSELKKVTEKCQYLIKNLK